MPSQVNSLLLDFSLKSNPTLDQASKAVLEPLQRRYGRLRYVNYARINEMYISCYRTNAEFMKVFERNGDKKASSIMVLEAKDSDISLVIKTYQPQTPKVGIIIYLQICYTECAEIL